MDELPPVLRALEGRLMELQEIDVIIDKDGQVRIEVRGVKGPSCLDLTKGLEAALGGQVEDRQMTPESQEAAQEQVRQQQQGYTGG
jgi:hypothetical protein